MALFLPLASLRLATDGFQLEESTSALCMGRCSKMGRRTLTSSSFAKGDPSPVAIEYSAYAIDVPQSTSTFFASSSSIVTVILPLSTSVVLKEEERPSSSPPCWLRLFFLPLFRYPHLLSLFLACFAPLPSSSFHSSPSAFSLLLTAVCANAFALSLISARTNLTYAVRIAGMKRRGKRRRSPHRPAMLLLNLLPLLCTSSFCTRCILDFAALRCLTAMFFPSYVDTAVMGWRARELSSTTSSLCVWAGWASSDSTPVFACVSPPLSCSIPSE
mmetsp:Transcript_1808/g.3847  ORF Transcript_1808/g.3847 Transcript_1808/m.3847 type:complete len:273 (-) Transcript_1808:55-873(-)